MIHLTPDIVYVDDEDFEALPLAAGAMDADTCHILALVPDSETYLDWGALVEAAYKRNDEAAAQFAASL